MLESLWKKILRRKGVSLLMVPAFLLWILSLGYGVVVFVVRRFRRAQVKVNIPVVSIGNIAVGGTGKTPILATLAEFLLSEGYAIGIISSAYGRKGKTSFVKPGYQIVEMSIEQTGDEIMMLAEQVPEAIFSIDNSKTRAAENAAGSGHNLDILLVDDGFQHFELSRDVDIVTYDGSVPPKHLRLFPYGVLREPLSALKRADVVIITRAKFAKDIGLLRKRLKRLAPQTDVYTAQFQAEELIGHNQKLPVKYLEDKAVLLFAGIGNFRALEKQVRALTPNLDHALELSDHQEFTPKLLNRIRQLADRFDSDVLLTTRKDWVKVRGFDFGREIYYLSQVTDLDPGEEKLVSFLQDRIDFGQKVG